MKDLLPRRGISQKCENSHVTFYSQFLNRIIILSLKKDSDFYQKERNIY
ncbi:hypothetical protein LEP1GSC059_2866 [Leptospira noguchii serovar Panama str. CZ214]|uniref:Uncharacterized protein n=1 Tax=Leptospira noguchii serovar Panama str. CZ214 TaxID=1001595 RepID=T0GQP3_9LEPT|nr:hypothetical protein LEP1GSC059_2866 [Leptospira noguchii serovar Panama str. CZ214]